MVAGDALRIFAELLPDDSLEAVHVYFPDPWWKKRHRKRRVMNGSVPEATSSERCARRFAPLLDRRGRVFRDDAGSDSPNARASRPAAGPRNARRTRPRLPHPLRTPHSPARRAGLSRNSKSPRPARRSAPFREKRRISRVCRKMNGPDGTCECPALEDCRINYCREFLAAPLLANGLNRSPSPGQRPGSGHGTRDARPNGPTVLRRMLARWADVFQPSLAPRALPWAGRTAAPSGQIIAEKTPWAYFGVWGVNSGVGPENLCENRQPHHDRTRFAAAASRCRGRARCGRASCG